MASLRMSMSSLSSSLGIPSNITNNNNNTTFTYTFRKTHFNFKLFTSSSPTPPFVLESETNENQFDWYAQWYLVIPVCDLDKRVPHGKKVIGIDNVLWWDRNEDSCMVFNDACPHRLAPLYKGRIDKWGRLQCMYHDWCFNGGGNYKLIPQAPPDGPLVHTFNKACTTVYPSTVQNRIVWFWPNSDPQCKDVLNTNQPP